MSVKNACPGGCGKEIGGDAVQMRWHLSSPKKHPELVNDPKKISELIEKSFPDSK